MNWRYFLQNMAKDGRQALTNLRKTNWTKAILSGLKNAHNGLAQTRPYFYGRLGLATVILGRIGYVYGTRFEREIKVTKSFHQLKEDLHGHTEYEYFVADKRHDLYRVTASWWYFQWYPRELWASLHENEKYRVVCYGFRSRKLKIYPNLVGVKKLRINQ